jgi:hypothetical protein
MQLCSVPAELLHDWTSKFLTAQLQSHCEHEAGANDKIQGLEARRLVEKGEILSLLDQVTQGQYLNV